MPTIDVSLKDVSRLLGTTVTAEEFDDLVLFAKGEVDDVNGDDVKVDLKDTNRPDLWSTEGIVRQLRGIAGTHRGIPSYPIEESDVRVLADPALRNVRPYCVNAVVTGLSIDTAFLSQIIQLQEKIALTFGRKRREVAVGIIDYDKITPPIHYKATSPSENAFVPLGFDRPMTPAEILRVHPKGIEYRHLVEGSDVYPLLIDSKGVVLTMPPIINSEHTGKVSTETKNIFIDVTGHDLETLKVALNVIVAAFSERGGTVHGVTVEYEEGPVKVPDLTPRTFTLEKDYVNTTLGITLEDDELIEVLEKMRFDAKVAGNALTVSYLPYRNDIMHANDVVEDIAIGCDYNTMEPVVPQLFTTGRTLPLTTTITTARELMIGLGFQEITSFTLSSNDTLFDRMRLERPDDVVEIENPVSLSWAVLRNWITPSLISFLSKNTHRDYPQNIFEISEVVSIDETKETMVDSRYKLACVLCHSSTNFTKAKEALDAFMRNIGVAYDVVAREHPSFLEGRSGVILVDDAPVGIIGEVHPEVITAWGIEMPISTFELELERLLE